MSITSAIFTDFVLFQNKLKFTTSPIKRLLQQQQQQQQCNNNRCVFSTQTAAKENDNENFKVSIIQQQLQHQQQKDPEWDTAKPYSSIPGPSKIGLIRAFAPGGKFHNLQFRDLSNKLRSEYGKIVKLPGMFGKRDMIFSYDANSFEKVFRTEGLWPDRKGIETFEYYREKVRPDYYKDAPAGLANEQGQKWYNIRTKVNPVMLQPKTVKQYIPEVDKVAQDFIDKKIRNSLDANHELPDTFGEELNKWSLESIGVIALEQRIGVLNENSENIELAKRLMSAIRDFFILSFHLEVLPSIWKYYKTDKFNKVIKAFDDMIDVATFYIDKALIEIEKRDKEYGTQRTDRELSVLEKLIKIDRRVAINMTLDMLLAGVDTTSAALVGCLYHLGKNLDKQEKLREEIIKIIPQQNSELNITSLNNIPYLRACIKEALRLSPIIPGNVRGAGKDIVINGYQIPKGKDIVMASYTLQMDDEIFPRANEYIPERFLKDIAADTGEYPSTKTASPFIYLPFGFGARSCIGRRFAEMEIEILLIRLLREYKIEWNYGEMKYFTGLIMVPSSPLKFKLTKI